MRVPIDKTEDETINGSSARRYFFHKNGYLVICCEFLLFRHGKGGRFARRWWDVNSATFRLAVSWKVRTFALAMLLYIVVIFRWTAFVVRYGRFFRVKTREKYVFQHKIAFF